MKEDSFIKLLEDNKWVLYKIINNYCYDEDDRKDLEQEIIIQLWKSIKGYKEKAKISTWIYRVAMNVAISFYRSNVKRKTKTDPLDQSLFYLEEDLSNRDEDYKILQRFINSLNPLHKEILLLYLDDLKYKEIAEIVGITESNVGTKINRLKKELSAYYNHLNKTDYGTR